MSVQQAEASDSGLAPVIETLSRVESPPIGVPVEAMTIHVTLPPGSPGAPPHRHPGPGFGYVIQGELRLEVEGRPERVVKAGEAFWEPGGDVIHYQDANNLSDAETTFVVVLLVTPGQPILTPVPPADLERRQDRRAPRA